MGEQRKLIDLTGKKFGRLIVQGRSSAPSRSKQAMWICLCDCGKTKIIVSQSIRSGHSTSCGCLHDEMRLTVPYKHGLGKTREYHVWKGMIKRCTDVTHKGYRHYGGRGITVCERWLNSVENFYADMGPRPARTTLDRIENDGNYEPGNCRWASHLTQGANKRNSRFVTAFGETHIISEWARRLGSNHPHIANLIKQGKSLEDFARRRGVAYGEIIQ
jgi:hypothetical protein